MIQYIIPSVVKGIKLERRCPHCHRPNGNIHTGIQYRFISDTKVGVTAQQRMKCPWCKTTWTIRSEGIGHSKQRSDRVISFGIFLYMLGLSYRDVAKCLKILGCGGSKSSIERDVSAAGQKAKALHLQGPRTRVKILGVDGTGAKIAGDHKQGLLFFSDIEHNKLICVEPVNEKDAQKVREHVLRVMREVGAGLSVSVILLGLTTFFVPVSSIRTTNQGNGIESVQAIEQAQRTAKDEKTCPPTSY